MCIVQRSIVAVRNARIKSSTEKTILYTLASMANKRRMTAEGMPIVAISHRELADACGIARSTCIAAVNRLCANGMLHKTMHGKTHYAIMINTINNYTTTR